ncbi:MAG: 7-carboxy-7-deazaguanine synthase [Saprospiraceae bacterium]
MSQKNYKVKEMYYTLQGEGGQAGRAAVFLRFSGCNLWSGREEDREKAICKFCDTDFWGTDGVNGGKYTAGQLAEKVDDLWKAEVSSNDGQPLVVCTGGEPLLQLDLAAITALKSKGFEIAVETNGTIELPEGLDWVCVSPKAGSELVVKKGSELKLVYPQLPFDPQAFLSLDFKYFFLQPMDGLYRLENTEKCVEYIKKHPKWRLSIQTHKLIGLP